MLAFCVSLYFKISKQNKKDGRRKKCFALWNHQAKSESEGGGGNSNCPTSIFGCLIFV